MSIVIYCYSLSIPTLEGQNHQIFSWFMKFHQIVGCWSVVGFGPAVAIPFFLVQSQLFIASHLFLIMYNHVSHFCFVYIHICTYSHLVILDTYYWYIYIYVVCICMYIYIPTTLWNSPISSEPTCFWGILTEASARQNRLQ